MTDLLSRAADLYPGAVFIDDGEGRLTFAEADRAVTAFPPSGPLVSPTLDASSILAVLAAIRSGGAVLVSPKWSSVMVEDRLAVLEGAGRVPGTVVFTSGSSGRAKAVQLLESNWEAAGNASSGFFGFGRGDTWLLSLPLYHVSGLSIVFRALCVGGSVLISPDGALLPRADFVSLVPTQLSRLRGYGRVRALVIGGSAVPFEIAERVRGWPVVRTYGMTETAAVAASASLDDGLGAMRALPGLAFRTGEGGRLEVRGPQVSPGYVGERPRGPDEWLVTADLGRVKGDGSLEVLGRADRVIASGGLKIDPAQVESVLAALAGIDEVAVFGLPDTEWGETVALVYSGDAEPDRLLAAVRRALGPESVPRRLVRIDRLPRNELGKVDYSVLPRLLT